MAEEHLTTKNGETQAETEGLADLMHRALWPITAFIKELEAQSDYGAQEELDRLLSFLVPIMDTVKENLEVLEDVLKQSLGYIEIEPTKKFRIFGGFRREDFGKAFIVAGEPQAAAPGGEAPPTPKTSEDWELDPVTKGNILRDAENLHDMASKIQDTAEALCHDLGLDLPPNIKKSIDRAKAARGAGQGGAA